MVTPTAARGWIRSPLWDASLLAFGWVPFYLWVALAPPSRAAGGAGGPANLGAALLVGLALNFLHRHYVLIFVYGDRAALAERPRAYWVAPVLAFTVVSCAVLSGLPGAKEAMLGALGAWNVWHVVQQRYGLLRIYAAKAGGGLETRAAAGRDRRLLWSSVFATAPVVVLLSRSLFESRPEAARIFSLVGPLLTEPVLVALAAVFGALFVVAAVQWVRGEARAEPRVRFPRYLFLASTFALLLVFVVHGPLVGYLVFGVAHSVEYLAFVHHFGERKYDPGKSHPSGCSAAAPAGDEGSAVSLAARMLGDIRRAPIILVPLLVAYVLLHEHRFSLAYITYFSTTSTLHYLYDGWIWRLRERKVAEPLAVGPG